MKHYHENINTMADPDPIDPPPAAPPADPDPIDPPAKG